VTALGAADFYAQYVLHGLHKLGVLGLDAADAERVDAHGRVPLTVIDDWFRVARAQIGDGVGPLLGNMVTPTALDVLGYASMESDSSPVRVVLTTVADAGDSVDLQVEAAFAGGVNFGRWIAATERRPLAIEFTHARAAPLALYEQTFGCEVRFRQARNAVCLSPDDLKLPLASPNRIVSSVMRAALHDRVAQFSTSSALMLQVEREMEDQLAGGEPTLADVAARIGMSGSSMKQALAASGISFAEVLDGTRRRLAEGYLQSSLPLSDIALRLGYSEQSAFSRACRRWFGRTPRQLRAKPDS
jgi:AraC-like DNA-binding protein